MDRRSAPIIVIAAYSTACGPERGDEIPDGAAERYADAICAVYEECGCGGMAMWSHPTGNACREETIATFRRVESWDARFELECFDRLLEWLPTVGCTADGWEFYEEFPDCLAFTGKLERGEQCAPEWDGGYGQLLGKPCAGTSSCVGYCAGPNQPARVGEGQRCNEREIRCDSTGVPGGVADLYCASDGICRPHVGLGEACDTPKACASNLDHYCAGLTAGGTGTCQERIPVGGACEPGALDMCHPGVVGFCSRDGICMAEMPKICEAVTGNLQVFEHLAFVPEE